MLLSEYYAELAAIVDRYARSGLIVAMDLSFDARTSKIGKVKGALGFTDGTQLFFTEYVDGRYRLERVTYAYHVQDAKANLLFRYDNAAHKPALPYSCHKHLNTGSIVEADPPILIVLIVPMLQRGNAKPRTLQRPTRGLEWQGATMS
jgi:hypothetical protein